MILENEAKTEDFSILSLSGETYESEETEEFYRDLNLLQVIDKLSAKWGREIRKYFLYLPEDPEESAYRRAVYRDVKKEAVYRALTAFTEHLGGVSELRREKEHVSNPMQRSVWKIRELCAYCGAYEDLAQELGQADLASDGMREFLRIVKTVLESGGYREMRQRTQEILQRIREIRFVITYDKERISVALEENPGDAPYEDRLNGMGGERTAFVNPFLAETSVTELEYACLEVLKKKKNAFFRELEDGAWNEYDCELAVLRRFEEEIRFYLAYRSLQLEMEAAGFVFATPEDGDGTGAGDGAVMCARGLYDMALALTAFSDGRKVIPNDFYYGEGERFFVLTGPNQGGKTTFARSLGQLVYLTKMGLDVPAVSAKVPHFPSIQTHFSVEESVETGRGKLMEELVRLAPMMDENQRGTFVIINELFTTAASYDALIMGKRVLEHFIGLGCMGIYVTHLKELADDREGVVSLRAMLNDQRIQTFEIRRGEAEDTACAENQVNKYRLTYEQLKERL